PVRSRRLARPWVCSRRAPLPSGAARGSVAEWSRPLPPKSARPCPVPPQPTVPGPCQPWSPLQRPLRSVAAPCGEQTTNFGKKPETTITGFSIPLGVFFADQDLALTGGVGLAHDAFLLHALHERSRPVVADLQPALDVAGRSFAVAHDHLHRLLVEVAALALAHAAGIEDRIAVLVLVVRRGDGLEVLRRALRFEMADDLLDLLVRAKRSVHAADASAAGHVEHVALAEQLLGALLAQNRASVDFGGDLERDAGRKISLDRAGDDIDRRPLRGQDHVQAGRARHL